MKTVKDVSKLTGISIRTLRYYDEIGLLKPAKLTDAGYRLYDSRALERLQEIMFFRELEIPLEDIKKIMENPLLDKKQILAAQKAMLEKKRNRLNGIIKLISDVMEGVNTMSFEEFDALQKDFSAHKECAGDEAEHAMVAKLADLYGQMLHMDNARNFLLDLAKEYQQNEKLAEAQDNQYGEGTARYMAESIQRYYGI